MSVALTLEQQLLKDAVRNVVSAVMPIESVQRQAEDAVAMDDGVLWNKLCELGLPGILVPERLGGAGLGFADVALVLEELGGGLIPTGLAVSGVVCAALLLAWPDPGVDGIPRRLASGVQRVALVGETGIAARQVRQVHSQPATCYWLTVERQRSGYCLHSKEELWRNRA